MRTGCAIARLLCALSMITTATVFAQGHEPPRTSAPAAQHEGEAAPSPAAQPASTLPSSSTARVVSSPWRLGVALGVGARTNPLIQSDDIPIFVDLDIAWFGERFFFDNGDLGWTFVDNDLLAASIVGRFNSDRVFFGRTYSQFVRFSATGEPLAQPVELSVPDRDYAIELGVEILTGGRWGNVELSAFHDVSGTHGGYEIYFDYAFGWRWQRWQIEPSAGFAYKSQALNDYYWGVRPDEANAALPAYRAGSGVNLHGRLAVRYRLTRHVTLMAIGEYARLNDEAAASPIVGERSVIGYFAGVGYWF